MKVFYVTCPAIWIELNKVEVSSGIFVLSCHDVPRKITLVPPSSLHHYEVDYAFGYDVAPFCIIKTFLDRSTELCRNTVYP